MEEIKNFSFKGVMLSNQPTQDYATNVKRSSKHGAQEGSFICGTVPTPWGLTSHNPQSKSNVAVTARLSKNNWALSRHKKWLQDMMKEKERKIQEKEEEERAKEKKKNEFREKQARRRAEARVNETNVECTSCDDDNRDEIHKRSRSLTASMSSSGEKRLRPAWSMTEEVAKQTETSTKEDEENDLLDFVNDLDFNNYCDDMELRILMSQVKERIRCLEKERHTEESRIRTMLDSEKAATHNEKYNKLISDIEESCEHKTSNSINAYEDDLNSIADSVRSDCNNSIASIHSRKSLCMLVNKGCDRLGYQDINDNKQITLLDALKEEEESLVEVGDVNLSLPKSITHIEDGGARIAETKSLNKLPFKNRNPAL